MQQNDSEKNSERGSSRNLLLGVLAALLAAFGYLYFFTGVIKQRQEPPQQASVPQQQVKQPMPPRPASPATNITPEAPAPTVKPGQPPPLQPATVPSKPAQPAKPAEPQPKQQVAASKPAPPKAVQPAPQPQKPVAPPPKPAVNEQKQAAAVNKGATPKPEQAKAPAKEPVHKSAAKKPPVSYRITTAETVSRQKADKIVEQLKKGGAVNVKKEASLTEHTMNRLYVTEFADRAAAGVELEKLRKSSPGAFILPSSGKYELYAGSYDKEKGAEIEKRRLESLGIKLTLQKASVKVPNFHVSAQASSKEAADESARIIRKLGVEATVARMGK